MNDVRQLVGDLIVASHELAALPHVPYERGVTHRFAAWLERTERWLQLVIDTGIAVHRDPASYTAELDGMLASVFADSSTLADLVYSVEDRFSYIGYEEGWLYGSIAWESLCVPRSAFELLRAMLASHDELAKQLDMESLDSYLTHWASELFEQLPVPDGIPGSHWWWFRSEP